MICHTVSCMIFSLLLIALGLWMYDHAFIMENDSCILKSRWHTWLRLTQLKYLMSNLPPGRALPLPDHARSIPVIITILKYDFCDNKLSNNWLLLEISINPAYVISDSERSYVFVSLFIVVSVLLFQTVVSVNLYSRESSKLLHHVLRSFLFP